MVAAENFVSELDAKNQASIQRVVDALQTALAGEGVEVADALRFAVKACMEAAEVAALWITDCDDLEMKLSLAEQCGDSARQCRRLAARLAGRGLQVMIEPGRSIAGPAGVLLTRVEYLKLDKARHFAVVDASMSELIRPALYGAWHEIVPVRESRAAPERYDVVGPVCESSDVLGTDRLLAISEGDVLAILAAGAYGMAMASNYNSRPRPAEVIVDRGHAFETRARETIASLYALEKRLDPR